jgi:hypothetical protein
LAFEKKETVISETFDLTHLPEGQYVYQIKQQGNIVSMGKWLKIK